MAITSRSRLLIAALLTLALIPIAKAAIACQRQPGHGYWTRYRMMHAIAMQARDPAANGGAASASAGGSVWSGPVARDTGKVFFVLDGSNYVCSAAALARPATASTAVIVTAAHCVTDGYGGWATDWTFVPGYVDGRAPYGSFTARKFFVSPRWNAGMNESYDVAFTPVHGLTGGLPAEFGRVPRSAYVFGYPAEPPYSGDSLSYCHGPVVADPAEPRAGAGVACPMTAGDSGGPWLARFDPGTGTGTVFGVSAFKYHDNDRVLYATTFGSTARSLYEQAAASG